MTRAPRALLLAGAPRRYRVSGPDPDRFRLFQRLRQDGNDGTGSTGNGTGSTGNGTGSTGNGTGSTGNGTGSTGNGTGSTGSGTGSTGSPAPGAPIRIALPGGRLLPGRALQTTPYMVAAELGAAEAALVARVNGALQDLEQPLEGDSDLELLDFNSAEGREAFWRSGAFVLGAVLEQFYGATFCRASATEDGFHCDVHMGDRTVPRGDLQALEGACAAFARAGHRFERLEAPRERLRELLEHNRFQLQQLEAVPAPLATLYRCGPQLQLCRGPLLRHTGLIGALRILSVRSVW
ncbi:threonine--tRNA ligase, mitochondrial, partial [Pezoporus occidentalis]|uniref:threonine--tRNA ligase, mitochondrial n=1 Tax=Pezoporus occidentalis TaxID=407982 RepID=UPI002F90C11C